MWEGNFQVEGHEDPRRGRHRGGGAAGVGGYVWEGMSKPRTTSWWRRGRSRMWWEGNFPRRGRHRGGGAGAGVGGCVGGEFSAARTTSWWRRDGSELGGTAQHSRNSGHRRSVTKGRRGQDTGVIVGAVDSNQLLKVSSIPRRFPPDSRRYFPPDSRRPISWRRAP